MPETARSSGDRASADRHRRRDRRHRAHRPGKDPAAKSAR